MSRRSPWKAPAWAKAPPAPLRTLRFSSRWQALPVVSRRKTAMIEQGLRRFCESKHRKLIVIGGTFVVGLLLVMPLVDVIRAGSDEKEALLAELESAQSVASELEA